METFYFTYGTEGHPFRGGWTEVIAPNMEIASAMFKAYHPCKEGSELLNCASIYTEGAFKKTRMYETGKNFGYGCHEQITLERYLAHPLGVLT